MSSADTQRFHHDYPYRMKLQHPDFAELRIERKGRWIRIDPASAPEPGEIVVLTSLAAARADATRAALRAGVRLTVVSSPDVLGELRAVGPFEGVDAPAEIDGVGIRLHAYDAPRPTRVPAPARLKASLLGADPVGTLRRAVRRTSVDPVTPHVVEVRFEDGARLLHADLSLHADTSEAWVDDALARFGNPEWMIVGQPWQQADAVARLAPRFGARRVLVTELINSERRHEGLPTELVTPLRDRLVAAGVEAHVFATQTSYRFE
jgi:hypothetical protein